MIFNHFVINSSLAIIIQLRTRIRPNVHPPTPFTRQLQMMIIMMLIVQWLIRSSIELKGNCAGRNLLYNNINNNEKFLPCEGGNIILGRATGFN